MADVDLIAYGTDDLDVALSPVPRLSANPSLTNNQKYSNNQSRTSDYTAINVTVGGLNEDGLDGHPAGASTLTATAANGTVIADAVTAASANHVTRWFLKRKTGTGTLEITTDNGGTWTDVTSDVTASFSEVLAEKAAVTDPQIGIRIVTSGDAVIVGNAELHTDTDLENVRGCGPIFTTTAAVSTTADDYSYAIANHSDTEMTYACEWTPGYSASEATGDQEIITLGTAPDMLYHDATNGDIESTDGTNTSTKAETITAGTTYDLEVAYSTGADSLQVSVDGTGGSDVAYDDAFPTGTKISLFRNSSFAQEMFAFTITGPDTTSIPVFAHHYMHNIG